MPSGEGQFGKRRGPYKGRHREFEVVRNLRREGFGYRVISGRTGINWKTIKGWVSDIPVDPVQAHSLSVAARQVPIDKLTKKSAIKLRLIAQRGHRCEVCHRRRWNGQPIPLELHRIEAGRPYTELENLQLVCPNCHSQTPNYRGRAIVSNGR